ncbi:calcium-translocating P-type ATPase, PMCA-type [Anaeromicropila herbilytica]|uniref:P-type Ca(2+) transporter n=1 Tax=Anaeromicropila herbilytica TaxID=2785025 RepID=A0A7R7ENC5_9FIRM|nr:calcium-translocating P-type ATPase, PMCA-type [Anaeromicropila herbilytica]BCN32004.1 ATPase [Anaeromicropila herbilytica]
MNWHSKSPAEVAKELQVTIEKGLSEKEVLKRQKKYGKNILETQKNKSILIKFLEQFSDFMIITLIVAAIISFLVSLLNGELNIVDPIIILLIITLNAILGVAQETKAERSLEALKKMSSPTALVKRDGSIQTIESNDLVPGDIIFLETGHFVPADARLIEANNLKVEESSLTGESHPVEKNAETTLHKDTLISDRINLVMATSIVTTGRGHAIVVHTGMDTEVGHIAKMIMQDEAPQTPLQKRLAKTSKSLGIAALIICVIIFIIGILRQHDIFDMFMTSVSLAVAAIPEGLPAIVTIMLSLGVQRMAKKNAVIRKLPAVETLGSATVICSDKTGTLTQNKMTVTEIRSIKGNEYPDSPLGIFTLTLTALCNNTILQVTKKEVNTTGEPTETAFIHAAYKVGLVKTKLDLLNHRVYEIPFDSTRKLMTTVHQLEDRTFRIITKGAPDVLLSKCNFIYENGKILTLTDLKKKQILKHNTEMANKALRVIAVAYKDLPTFSKSQPQRQIESSLIFVSLIGLIDPPRKEVYDAVTTCKMAGIKPVMITGDHVDTACAIAKELGIMGPLDKAITGAELNVMSKEELDHNIYQYSVFARVSPEHKVRIVKAFQNNNEVVAMTGDGVNDAPALKSADIGCAMGIGGTDVAKNAADMILTDDNFATIVSAVREGRGIYDNIKKAIHFLLSSNIGEIITIFVAIILGLPSPLLAVQLLWVNLVTDSLPAISLGVEPAAKDIMKKKPIPLKKGMFADGLVFKIIFEGMMIGALALSAFVIGIKCFDEKTYLGILNPEVGRTMSFAVLSLSQLFHSFNMRSDHSIMTIGLLTNMKLFLSFLFCTFLQVIVISYEPLAAIFKVVPLTSLQWVIVFALSFVPIIIIEMQKRANNY